MRQPNALPEKIKIVEVGPRDGLQQLPLLPHTSRATLVNKLAAAGLKYIETSSFVSHSKVPAMIDSDKVLKEINRLTGVTYTALTPNIKGFELALEAGVSEVAVFSSASEGFCKKNINCSISESFDRFEPVILAAKKHNIQVRGYVSCIMGCPYDGTVMPEQVATICKDMMQMGCYEISLGDTIGVGTPLMAKKVFNTVADCVPISCIAAHFHNTYGQALANLYAVIEEGLCVIDSSIAGLGGCPYAPGASGNVATEDVIYMLNGMGIKTGVDMQLLLKAADYICQQLGIQTQSNTGLASLSKRPSQKTKKY